MIFCSSRDFCGADLLTTRTDLLLQLVKALVRSIGNAFFDQRPDSLRGIQLRCVSWHAQQRDALRDIQGRGPMRWRAVPDQKDALTFSGVPARKLIEKSLHTISIQSRQDEPEDAPRLWMCRCIEPEPFIALINFTERALSLWRPDAALHRLETKPSFVLAPDFHFLVWICCLKGLHLKFYLFLNTAGSSRDARRLFDGRGT